MEVCGRAKPSHKEWRRIAKRERRRRVRREAARERDADADRLRTALERSAGYLSWLDEQDKQREERERRERLEHAERERLWLEEEARAQEEWRKLDERKQKAEQQKLQQQMQLREEFESKQEAIRKRREEEKRRQEEQIQMQEQLQKEIDDYIDNGVKTPEPLRQIVDTQPAKEFCSFFTKTGACRFGDTCSKNHRKVLLSNVILLPGFYSHFSLEKNTAEYDTDIALEYESSETQHDFHEFYRDVIIELRSFGKIKTLRCCCNTEVHLRGNVYVEYYTEREAARAWRTLKGRWYAGKQLNCEFVNLKSWTSAICGMSKCPKGRACNFLHTFKNPRNEYGIKSPPRWTKNTSQLNNSKKSEHRTRSRWEESVRSDDRESRNWRWSESPEIELQHSSKSTKEGRSGLKDGKRSRKSSRERNEELSTRRSRSSSKKRRRSDKEKKRSKSNDREIENERSVSNGGSLKKYRKKSSSNEREKSRAALKRNR